MPEVKQGTFEGWAIVEMMGHQREIGFVTTEAFGQAVMFRVDVPDLEEREFVLTIPEYTFEGNRGRMTPAGSRVKREAAPGRSRLVAPGSLYAINPCTRETAFATLERATSRPLLLLELAPGQALLPATFESTVPEDGDDGYRDGDDG